MMTLTQGERDWDYSQIKHALPRFATTRAGATAAAVAGAAPWVPATTAGSGSARFLARGRGCGGLKPAGREINLAARYQPGWIAQAVDPDDLLQRRVFSRDQRGQTITALHDIAHPPRWRRRGTGA